MLVTICHVNVCLPCQILSTMSMAAYHVLGLLLANPAGFISTFQHIAAEYTGDHV